MAEKVNPYLGKGIFPWLVLTEGPAVGGPPASQGNLRTWMMRTPQPYTGSLDSVDPQTPLEEFFGVGRDHFLIIDLRTMKLVEMFDSNPTAAFDYAVGLL